MNYISNKRCKNTHLRRDDVAPCGANDVALRANDVMLRINDVVPCGINDVAPCGANGKRTKPFRMKRLWCF